ncbi:MAG: SDR family oxidoreductase [Anaerolineae bacterium]|nr:SDR family oxidoreductase [Anaerolineae bacterium]MDW8099919.1 SDR family oxidoreductase [Anaerolineae bacterium]
MSKILVTGGAGFIGSHVVDAFINAGHEVVVIDNLATGKRENVNPKAQFYQVDIRDQETVEEVFAVERPEVISHQAALANVRHSMEQPVTYAEVNILGSIILLEMARKYECRRFIYASTGGAVYGEPEFLPVTEDHPINPLDPYGASKHAVEHYLYLYRHNYGLSYVSLRYPNVYGPRQDPLGEAGVVAIFTGLMLQGKQPTINGSGEQQRDFVYVGDVACANLLALERGEGVYNIGSGVPTDVNTIFAELKAATGYSGEAHYGPPKLGEVFRIYLDASKARRELGWEPTVSLKEGLARTVEFFRQSAS